MDKRKYESREIELRAAENTDKMIIEGYAIVFEQPATYRYGDRSFTETIKRGALNGADMSNVPMRYNHNDNVMVMARTKNNSLQLVVDETGLLIRAELIDTQSNKDLYKGIQERLIDKMSFAFTVAENGDIWTMKDKESLRDVTKIDKIYDVSVVDTPFYDGTSIYARSFDLLDDELKQLDGSGKISLRKRKLKLKRGI